MVSGTTSAPLTAAIIIYEMTLDYSAVLPIMTAVSIAYAVRRYFMKGDIYTLKLNRRGEIIPEELVADLKSHILIDDAVSRNITFLSEQDKVSGNEDFACILDNNQVTGVVELLHLSIGKDSIPVNALRKRNFVVLRTGTTVADAVMQFHNNKSDIALVSKTGDLDKESIIGVATSTHLIRLIGEVTSTLR